MKNVKIDYKTIVLSISVFILTSVVFSRLMLLSISRKVGSNSNIQKSPVQVLSLEDEELDEYENNDLPSKLMPDNFPTDIPIYPGAVLEDSWVNSADDVVGISVLWHVDDEFEDIVNYYESEFERLGWAVNVVLDDEISFTMSFSKNNVDGFVGTTRDERGVVISVTLGVKKNL